MSPIVALDLGNRRNVASTERGGFAWKDDKKQAEDQERTAPAHSEACHCAVKERYQQQAI
jgi:hypothetical protein